MKSARVAVLNLLFSMVMVAVVQAADPADRVAYNGKIYTSNDEQPWATAVAISGTDIVYVGDDKGVAAFIGEDTILADLGERVVLPGIIGTHEHPLASMAIASGGILSFSRDADTMLKEAAEHLERNPQGPFFTFGGSQENTVPITKEKIDAIISDKPFLMVASTGHGGWINSSGLKALGIEKDTPDPIDSFERDASGAPTGNILSSAAVMYTLVELGLLSKEAVMAKADEIFGYLSSLGITAVFDPGQPVGTEEMTFSVMDQLESEDRLSVRVMASALTQRERHLEGAIEVLKTYGPKYSSELFNVNALKLHGGSPDGYTSAFLEPYSDRPDFYGDVPYSFEAQKQAALAAAELGYDIHTHVIGNKNVRQALDVYEAVRTAGYKEVRLSTGHTGLVHPDDMERFKELDIIVNTYGLRNAEPDAGPLVERLGMDRIKNQFWQPMKSFVNMGVRLTASADWPTSPIDPFKQIVVFMTRSTPETEEFMPRLSEALTLEESLKAYTINAAYQLRLEEKIGSIEEGKRADMIVIDRDIFKLEPDEIWDTNVLVTMMNGRIVHEESVDWGPERIGVEGLCICHSTPKKLKSRSDSLIEQLDDLEKN